MEKLIATATAARKVPILELTWHMLTLRSPKETLLQVKEKGGEECFHYLLCNKPPETQWFKTMIIYFTHKSAV